MAECVSPEVVDLTLDNVVRALEGVEEWSALGCCLCVPDSIRSEIKGLYSSVEERVRAVVEYWWAVDPTPSWRRIITALDSVRELQIADQIRHNAEPLTDSTLTLTNVTNAVAGVYWIWLSNHIYVPDRDSIFHTHHLTTDDQKREVVMRHWLQYFPNPSWRSLAGLLYFLEEHTALKRVMEYIQQPTDPTLTVANLCAALEELNTEDMSVLGSHLDIPEHIRYPKFHHLDPVQYLQALLRYWLSNHPAPSWRSVAEVLYQCFHYRNILENVLDTYIRGITLHNLCLRYIVSNYEYFSPLLHHLPSPVQRQIMKRRMIYTEGFCEYGKFVAAERRACGSREEEKEETP